MLDRVENLPVPAVSRSRGWEWAGAAPARPLGVFWEEIFLQLVRDSLRRDKSWLLQFPPAREGKSRLLKLEKNPGNESLGVIKTQPMVGALLLFLQRFLWLETTFLRLRILLEAGMLHREEAGDPGISLENRESRSGRAIPTSS